MFSMRQTTSKCLVERKIEKFEKNITKRGLAKKGSKYSVGHIIIGVFIFVVVGSCMYALDLPNLPLFVNINFKSICFIVKL